MRIKVSHTLDLEDLKGFLCEHLLEDKANNINDHLCEQLRTLNTCVEDALSAKNIETRDEAVAQANMLFQDVNNHTAKLNALIDDVASIMSDYFSTMDRIQTERTQAMLQKEQEEAQQKMQEMRASLKQELLTLQDKALTKNIDTVNDVQTNER